MKDNNNLPSVNSYLNKPQKEYENLKKEMLELIRKMKEAEKKQIAKEDKVLENELAFSQ